MNFTAKNHAEAADFIDSAKIETLLTPTNLPSKNQVDEIIAKSKELKGLDESDIATLLKVNAPEQLQSLFEAANEVKEVIYGKRLVIFAPLYVSNFCSNNCSYCAFSGDSKEIKRRALTQEEIARETRTLIASGHKRILLVAGESDRQSHLEYICDTIDTIYKQGDANNIRRVNVNIAPLDQAGFETLKSHKIGTYQLFQETYHRPTYKEMHTRGPKADFDYRVTVMDRAMAAGIDDVGVGILFGLHDYRFEILALMQHIKHLETVFGTGPHTISVPRLEPATGAPAALNPPAPLSDEDFLKTVAVLRLAVPYTGIILSTRESPEMRSRVLDLGVSQISAGSRTEPGGYCDADDPDTHAEPQFQLGDHRTLDEVVKDVLSRGFLPSFCTGCYRKGRTGQDFMDLAKPGLIKHYCLPNGLITLKEYLEDYASEETRILGEKVIAEQLNEIPSEKRKASTQMRLKEIEQNKRDLYF